MDRRRSTGPKGQSKKVRKTGSSGKAAGPRKGTGAASAGGRKSGGRASSGRGARKRTGGRTTTGGKGSGAKPPSKRRQPAARAGRERSPRSGRENRAAMLSLGRDAARAAAILDELEFRHGIDVSTLDVAIEDGALLARGLVSDADELESVRETLLEACVDDVPGFHVVVAPGRREEDRDQANLIQEYFDQDGMLGRESIQVACYVDKVVLRGSVASETAKVMAGILALRIGRAARLRNRLVVVP